MPPEAARANIKGGSWARLKPLAGLPDPAPAYFTLSDQHPPRTGLPPLRQKGSVRRVLFWPCCVFFWCTVAWSSYDFVRKNKGYSDLSQNPVAWTAVREKLPSQWGEIFQQGRLFAARRARVIRAVFQFSCCLIQILRLFKEVWRNGEMAHKLRTKNTETEKLYKTRYHPHGKESTESTMVWTYCWTYLYFTSENCSSVWEAQLS